MVWRLIQKVLMCIFIWSGSQLFDWVDVETDDRQEYVTRVTFGKDP